MLVKDVMTGAPVYCTVKTNLGEAAALLWSRDCGMLPVVDGEKKVIGVVTDRDMFFALATRSRMAGELTVGEVAPAKPFICKSEDEIHFALEIMARHKVRRLPVVGKDGRIEGVLSLDDVVLHARPKNVVRSQELCFEDVIATMKKIYETRSPVVMYRSTAAD